MNKPLLATEDLSIGRGRAALMNGIRMELYPGTLTAMIGVNGIGKSTLLRTLAGLLKPLAGHVRADGEAVERLTAAKRARHIAVVLTGRPSTGILDVETLVNMGRQPWTGTWGRLGPEDHRAVEEALRRTGAAHLRRRKVDACSDGECQKVLIARALAQGTPILLLDEPTAFLDLPNRAEIVRLLRRVAHEEGKTVLFSTHDLQLALDLCDQVLLLRRGQGPWQGSPAEALASGELARAFEGTGVQFDPRGGTHRFLP